MPDVHCWGLQHLAGRIAAINEVQLTRERFWRAVLLSYYLAP